MAAFQIEHDGGSSSIGVELIQERELLIADNSSSLLRPAHSESTCGAADTQPYGI